MSLYRSAFQSGTHLVLLEAKGATPLAGWGAKKGVATKVYNKDVRTYVIEVAGQVGAKITHPEFPERQGLGITQPYFGMQLYVPKDQQFTFHLTVFDQQRSEIRFMFSTANRVVKVTPLHARIPLHVVAGAWSCLVFDLVEITRALFPKAEFASLKSVEVMPSCTLLRVFTLRACPLPTIELYSPEEEKRCRAKPMYPRPCFSMRQHEPLPQKLEMSAGVHAQVVDSFYLSLFAEGRKGEDVAVRDQAELLAARAEFIPGYANQGSAVVSMPEINRSRDVHGEVKAAPSVQDQLRVYEVFDAMAEQAQAAHAADVARAARGPGSGAGSGFSGRGDGSDYQISQSPSRPVNSASSAGPRSDTPVQSTPGERQRGRGDLATLSPAAAPSPEVAPRERPGRIPGPRDPPRDGNRGQPRAAVNLKASVAEARRAVAAGSRSKEDGAASTPGKARRGPSPASARKSRIPPFPGDSPPAAPKDATPQDVDLTLAAVPVVLAPEKSSQNRSGANVMFERPGTPVYRNAAELDAPGYLSSPAGELAASGDYEVMQRSGGRGMGAGAAVDEEDGADGVSATPEEGYNLRGSVERRAAAGSRSSSRGGRSGGGRDARELRGSRGSRDPGGNGTRGLDDGDLAEEVERADQAGYAKDADGGGDPWQAARRSGDVYASPGASSDDALAAAAAADDADDVHAPAYLRASGPATGASSGIPDPVPPAGAALELEDGVPGPSTYADVIPEPGAGQTPAPGLIQGLEYDPVRECYCEPATADAVALDSIPPGKAGSGAGTSGTAFDRELEAAMQREERAARAEADLAERELGSGAGDFYDEIQGADFEL